MVQSCNKTNMRKWIKALRSGKYEQGPGALWTSRDNSFDNKPRYCCLGVACEVHTKGGARQAKNASYGYLPPKVGEWLGLSDEDPALVDGRRCSVANDIYHATFEEIADLLEKTFLGKTPNKKGRK